jgi:hypothetical protein
LVTEVEASVGSPDDSEPSTFAAKRLLKVRGFIAKVICVTFYTLAVL